MGVLFRDGGTAEPSLKGILLLRRLFSFILSGLSFTAVLSSDNSFTRDFSVSVALTVTFSASLGHSSVVLSMMNCILIR